jgi:hypothetical protein
MMISTDDDFSNESNKEDADNDNADDDDDADATMSLTIPHGCAELRDGDIACSALCGIPLDAPSD